MFPILYANLGMILTALVCQVRDHRFENMNENNSKSSTNKTKLT